MLRLNPLFRRQGQQQRGKKHDDQEGGNEDDESVDSSDSENDHHRVKATKFHPAHEEDDEEEETDGGVIAIGILQDKQTDKNKIGNRSAPADHEAETPDATPPPPRNEQEATSLAVSQAVAETLAEKEHNMKQKQRLSMSGSASPRMSPRRASWSRNVDSSKDTATPLPMVSPRAEEWVDSRASSDAAVQGRTVSDLVEDRKPSATESAAAMMVARRRSSYMARRQQEMSQGDSRGNQEEAQEEGQDGSSSQNPMPDTALQAVGDSTTTPPSSFSQSFASTTSLLRQLSTQDNEGGDETVQLARAVPRSSRFSVRGEAAVQEQSRTRSKVQEDSGPSLACGTSNTMVRNTAWTNLDTDMVVGDNRLASSDGVVNAGAAPSPALQPSSSRAYPMQATSMGEDRVQAKLARENQRQGDAPALAMAPARHFSGGQSNVSAAPSEGLGSLEAAERQLREMALGPRTLNENGNVQGTNWAAFVPPTPARALEPSRQEQDDEVDLEADAGIQVRPGAFAIQGMDANEDSASTVMNYNDDLEENNYNAEGPQELRSAASTFLDPSSEFLVDGPQGLNGGEDEDEDPDEYDLEQAAIILQGGALQAEIYEREVFEGNIVEDDEYEYEVDPKLVRRLRLVQAMALCFSIVGIVSVIMSAISGFGAGNNNGPPEIPIITGWNLVGSQTFAAGEKQDLLLFGSAVAISSNGARVVVSTPGAEQGDQVNVGETTILEERTVDREVNGTTITTNEWQVMYTLPGVGANLNPVSSLSISDDASLVAVGYPFYVQGGIVQIFNEARGWQSSVSLSYDHQLDNTTGLQSSDESLTGFGHAIDLSPDGMMLAVGAPLFESQQASVTGFVHVYQQIPKTDPAESPSWVRLGSSNDDENHVLKGTHSNELFGWSVSLRNNRVAVGSPSFDTDRGLARVFEWTPSDQQWRQVGPELSGTEILQRFGESVALSDDGTILAVGARGTAFDPGFVKVFRHQVEADGQESWTSDDQIFVGDSAGDGLGASVTLSKDGNTLAIGAPESSEFGTGSGHIQVWMYNEDSSQWVQEGSKIGGPLGSNMGSSVALSVSSLSNNGNDASAETTIRVVGGAPTADYDGSIINAGSFFVFDREEGAILSEN